MFDPRLTEEYCGLAGMPWSDQDASGEIAAMAVGASLWGLFNHTGEFGSGITKPGSIGCSVRLRQSDAGMPGSPVFDKARAIGLRVKDWQDVILVNMLGKRFYDETGRHFTSNNYDSVEPYVPSIIATPRTSSTTRTTSSTRRWPASATATTAAVRSGPFSTPMRPSARTGTRSRRMSIAMPASSSARTRLKNWPRRS